MVTKAKKLLGDNVKGKTIGVLGLSFKPDTDDMRDASSITIINNLQEEGAIIKAYDPVAMKVAEKRLSNVDFCEDSYAVAKDADILIIVTEWNEFKKLDLEKIKKLMKNPVILDGRNIYNPQEVKKIGFIYQGVGRA
jgi:UDPglucose 6-dehydrogenase